MVVKIKQELFNILTRSDITKFQFPLKRIKVSCVELKWKPYSSYFPAGKCKWKRSALWAPSKLGDICDICNKIKPIFPSSHKGYHGGVRNPQLHSVHAVCKQRGAADMGKARQSSESTNWLSDWLNDARTDKGGENRGTEDTWTDWRTWVVNQIVAKGGTQIY